MHSMINNILVVFAPLVTNHKINMLFNQNWSQHQQPSAFTSALEKFLSLPLQKHTISML